MFPDIFMELAVLLLLAAGIGALGTLLKQPLIVSFIVVGILVGPSVLAWVGPNDRVDLLAKLGITLLLFVVGLRLDLHIIRTMGMVALATGLGQVLFTSVVGYGIAIALGMSPIASVYVAVALTFSSTIIIVKLLSDKREVDTLHGRIALGFLIVQDLVVVLVMIGLNALNSAGDGAALPSALFMLAKGAAFLTAVALLMRYAIPWLMSLLSRSSELLVLAGIAWATSLAVSSALLGFSQEVGAFVAGVSLASTPFRDALGARLVTLRDFLLLFFFIDLGARLDLGMIDALLFESVVFSLFVLIGNPLIVMLIMGLLGYRKRTGFLAGLTVAQISEFSLILGALGVSLGHIDAQTMGLITLVGLITISASTYLIIYSHPLYDRLSPWLGVFERRNPRRELQQGLVQEDRSADIVLLGVGRYGSCIAQVLWDHGRHVLCVDHNPDLVLRGDASGRAVIYGDIEDPEFLGSLPLARLQWVVCTVHSLKMNRLLVDTLKSLGFPGRIAVTAHGAEEAAQLRQAGASLVMVPFADAARHAAEQLLIEQPTGLIPPAAVNP